MRRWFDENLHINLERSFRCMNPTKLFPIWLGQAKLRGESSLIGTNTFDAIPPQRSADTGKHATGASRSEKETNDELRCVAGRMLWQEVWGPYVTASRWFWDDAECAEECRRLKTTWEYHVVDAMKE